MNNSSVTWIQIVLLFVQVSLVAVFGLVGYFKLYRQRVIYGIKRLSIRPPTSEPQRSEVETEKEIAIINDALASGNYTILQMVARSEYDIDVYLGQVKREIRTSDAQEARPAALTTRTQETTWGQAFRRNLWILLLFIPAILVAFVIDATRSGITSNLALVYFLTLTAYAICFYLPFVALTKNPAKTTYIILIFITGVFAVAAPRGSPVSDAIRSFIQERVDLTLFVGALTVLALLIAIYDVLSRESRNKPKS